MLPAVLLSLALCSAVRAGAPLDVATSNTPPRLALDERIGLDPSISATCPVRNAFSVQEINHLRTGVCTHNKPNRSPQKASSIELESHSSPWNIHPTCTTNTSTKFCVFTSQIFHNNRGITVLTTPSTAQFLSRLPAFTNKTQHLSSLSENDQRDPPFTITSIPGRGMGLIANRTIERGDLIKSHPAIAILHNTAVSKADPLYATHYSPLLYLAIDQLPASTQTLFHSLAAHNESEEPYIEKIYTNTFAEDFNGEEHSILIPETARLNHDCRPNAMYYFDARKLVHYTHAARRIIAREEITITYVDPLQTRLKRRNAVKRSWGFECTCSLCSQGEDFVRESNRRVIRIGELLKVFGDLEEGRNERKVRGSPEMAELLVGLYEQERLFASVADACRIAALAYAARGMEWKAVEWAMKAVEAGLIHDGPRGEGVLDMKRLLSEPRKHWSWGLNL